MCLASDRIFVCCFVQLIIHPLAVYRINVAVRRVNNSIFKMKLCQRFIALTVIYSVSAVYSEENIHGLPVIFGNSTSRNLIVQEGQTVRLECFAGGSPDLTISWIREGLVYEDDILNIWAIKKRDRGIYMCVAENNLGEKAYRRINIKVEFAPIIYIPCANVVQSINHEASLECIIEAYPVPFVIWLKDGIQIISDDILYSISQSITSSGVTYSMLKMTILQYEQFGKYSCKAINHIGSTEDFVYVTPPSM